MNKSTRTVREICYHSVDDLGVCCDHNHGTVAEAEDCADIRDQRQMEQLSNP